MNDRVVILLSGGLDSTVAAAMARAEGARGIALSADYGQRAARSELRSARAIAKRLGFEWREVHLPWLGRLGANALTDRTRALPEPAPQDLDGQAAHQSAAHVWVPNRNGLLLNVAAAYADAGHGGRVIMGFNREEAATFPDNSAAFIDAANGALSYSCRREVRLASPTVSFDKRELVERARALDAPLEWVWVCYRDAPRHCGRCESCRRFERALERAGALEWWQERREAVAAQWEREP